MYRNASSSNSRATTTQQPATSDTSNSPSSTVIAAIFISELTLKNSKEDHAAFLAVVRCISSTRSAVKSLNHIGENATLANDSDSDSDDNVLYGALLLLLRLANSRYRFPTSLVDGADLFRVAYAVALKAFADAADGDADSGANQLQLITTTLNSESLYADRGKNKAKYAQIMKGICEKMDADVIRSSDTIRGLIPEFRGMLEDDFATNKQRTRFGYPRKFEAV